MSEVVSFGNIVNSLRAVRNDYNEHLKAVPQYEAFLLVESSTQSVADKLQDVAPAMAAEVVEALEAAKAKFRQHLTSVPQYRALLAIDKLIGDVAADLGVQAVVPAQVETQIVETQIVETQIEAATDAISPPAEIEQPVADQQAAARAEATEPPSSQPERVPQLDATLETAAPVRVVAQAEAQGELTTADVLSQLQIALQAAETAPDQAAVAGATQTSVASATDTGTEVQPASPDPLQVQEVGPEAERAA